MENSVDEKLKKNHLLEKCSKNKKWKSKMAFAIREGVNGKKTFSFGHCLNDGGGSTHARIFWPSF